MRTSIAFLLFVSVALSGCAGCYIDAMPQSSKPSVALDCETFNQ